MTDDLRGVIARRASLASALLWLPTFAGFLGGVWWLFDLFAHFRVQYALCGLICLGASLLRPSRRAALAVIPLAVNLACIAPLYLGPSRGEATDRPALVITAFNVHTANPEKEAVTAFLARSGADVIFLYEVDQAWLDAMAKLPEGYRMIKSIPSRDNFGIAAIARVPVTSHRVLVLSEYGVPSIELTLPWDGKEVVLLGTHTLPPINSGYAGARDEQLANLAEWSTRESRPHALVGDLNTTPWSSHFRALLERSRLRDFARGWTPTWPSSLLFFLRIPIDHALLSPELTLVDLSIGDSCGSDHRPLTASLVVDR